MQCGEDCRAFHLQTGLCGLTEYPKKNVAGVSDKEKSKENNLVTLSSSSPCPSIMLFCSLAF